MCKQKVQTKISFKVTSRLHSMHCNNEKIAILQIVMFWIVSTDSRINVLFPHENFSPSVGDSEKNCFIIAMLHQFLCSAVAL